jgi:hypothetical protein
MAMRRILMGLVGAMALTMVGCSESEPQPDLDALVPDNKGKPATAEPAEIAGGPPTLPADPPKEDKGK